MCHILGEMRQEETMKNRVLRLASILDSHIKQMNHL